MLLTSHDETVLAISFTTTAAWHRMNSVEDAKDIGRWTQLDAATAVRCGHDHSQQVWHSFHSPTTGASSLLDNSLLTIYLLGGHISTSLTDHWRDG